MLLEKPFVRKSIFLRSYSIDFCTITYTFITAYLKNSIMNVILLVSCTLFGCMAYAQQTALSLEGEWRVRLDSLEQGEINGWHLEKSPSGMPLKLPGTLDEAGIGKKSTISPELKRPVVDQLTRKY